MMDHVLGLVLAGVGPCDPHSPGQGRRAGHLGAGCEPGWTPAHVVVPNRQDARQSHANEPSARRVVCRGVSPDVWARRGCSPPLPRAPLRNPDHHHAALCDGGRDLSGARAVRDGGWSWCGVGGCGGGVRCGGWVVTVVRRRFARRGSSCARYNTHVVVVVVGRRLAVRERHGLAPHRAVGPAGRRTTAEPAAGRQSRSRSRLQWDRDRGS
jgi:hypothetical protein